MDRFTPIRSIVGLTLLAALALGLFEGAAQAAAPSRPVIARTGELTSRPADLPSTSEAARQIESARVRQDLAGGRISATVTLRAEPGAATVAWMTVGFGRLSGTVCEGTETITADTVPGSSFDIEYDGPRISFDQVNDDASTEIWDCAFVALDGPDGTTTYDALVGPLSDVLAPPKPRLRVKVKPRLVLKPGRWARITVKAANPGTGPARKVVLRLKPRNMKVSKARLRLGSIAPGNSKSRRIKVKLKAARAGRVAVVASGRGLTAKDLLLAEPRTRSRRPVAGRYESKDRRVAFRIAGRRLVGFHARILARCGGFPDPFTYQWGTYDAPAARIRAGGRVRQKISAELYTTTLEARVSGSRVTGGRFTYSGPNRCYGSTTFTARRVG